MEIVLNNLSPFLIKLLDKGEYTLLFFTLCTWILLLIYSLHSALAYKVLFKQMTVYRDRMRPITERIKGNYALCLRAKIDSGALTINHQHYSNILYRQSDLIDTCASKGEQYLRSRLFENHIPKPSKDCLGQNCETCQESACRKFREFCEGTFNSHAGIFWGEYRARYDSDFFPLDIFEREAHWEEDRKRFFVEWCELMITLSQISKDRWSLK